MANRTDAWQTVERDPEIDGWKITLSGYRGSFYVKDQHLHDLGLSLDQFMAWLREKNPHRSVWLDS